jgi:hypothetical protein
MKFETFYLACRRAENTAWNALAESDCLLDWNEREESTTSVRETRLRLLRHTPALPHLFEGFCLCIEMMSSTATLSRSSKLKLSLVPADPQAMATSSEAPQSEPQHLASSSPSDTSVTSNHDETHPHFITNMFGALNRFIAKLDAAPEEQNSNTQGFGFQVLKNTNPELPLEPWFDFIIGISARMIVGLMNL